MCSVRICTKKKQACVLNIHLFNICLHVMSAFSKFFSVNSFILICACGIQLIGGQEKKPNGSISKMVNFSYISPNIISEVKYKVKPA